MSSPAPFLFLALFSASCVSAQISVVDERTALENQILGSYEELDRDLRLLASVRAVDLDGKVKPARQLSDIRAQAIAARQVHQFNRDDVDELKSAGCLGESLTGKLVGRPCPTAGKDPKIVTRIDRLLQSENQARETILLFVVTTSPDLTQGDLPGLRKAYAEMQRSQAKAGEWIQTESGSWTQKP